MASYNESKKKAEEVVETLRDAIKAGNEAWDAVNRFHGKFLEASAKAGMLTEIRAPFDHICQGAKSFTNYIYIHTYFIVSSPKGLFRDNQ